MAKISAADIAKKVQELYAPKDHNRSIITTGKSLKRPTKPEEFILAPKNHPWVELTGLLGLPYDSIIQVAGKYDSGKSTVAGEFMAEAQRQGVYVVLGDAEKKFDKLRYDNQFKGNSDELMIVQSTMIRKLAGGMFKYIKAIKEADKTAKILIVHDSIGGSVSRSRLEQEIDSDAGVQPGTEAKENSDYMKHLVALIDRYPGSISVMLINQMTDKIGFGQKGQSRSGGHKISFHSSLIIEMKKIKTLTKTVNKVKMKTGIVTTAKIDKNHLSQGENSVSEMNIMVNAKGWQKSDFTFEKDDE